MQTAHDHLPPPCPCGQVADRRRFLGLVAAGACAALAGCSVTGDWTATTRRTPATTTTGPTTTTTPPPPPTTLAPVVQLDAVPPPRPGPPEVVFGGPARSTGTAVTIDDGFCTDCVTFYVGLAQRTGLHLTFSPNGTYRAMWEPHAPVLRDLIAAGQVQLGNHTYSHPDLVKLSDSTIRKEIEQNDQWLEQTFGITARSWFRPPYGSHNPHTDGVVGELGYTRILLWNGSFGDSAPISPQQLLALAGQYMTPGRIVLGHANYPTIEPLWGQIEALISTRGLTLVTLDEMFGTSRNTG